MNIKIVKAQKDEWAKLKKLRLQSLQEAPLAFGSEYEEEVILPDEKWQERMSNLVLFAKNEDNQIVGMINAVMKDRSRTKHIGTIHGVYVDPKYRGQKIGKKLLISLLEILEKEYGAEKINLTANTIQTSAVALYTSVGFRKVGILEKELKINDTYYDEIIMEKIL